MKPEAVKLSLTRWQLDHLQKARNSLKAVPFSFCPTLHHAFPIIHSVIQLSSSVQFTSLPSTDLASYFSPHHVTNFPATQTIMLTGLWLIRTSSSTFRIPVLSGPNDNVDIYSLLEILSFWKIHLQLLWPFPCLLVLLLSVHSSSAEAGHRPPTQAKWAWVWALPQNRHFIGAAHSYLWW